MKKKSFSPIFKVISKQPQHYFNLSHFRRKIFLFLWMWTLKPQQPLNSPDLWMYGLLFYIALIWKLSRKNNNNDRCQKFILRRSHTQSVILENNRLNLIMFHFVFKQFAKVTKIAFDTLATSAYSSVVLEKFQFLFN